MTAKDYPVTFGYLAKADLDGNGTLEYTHRGNDRKTPTGTPIVIEGVTIGHTGNTGLSKGPHLHTQVGTDPGVQKTINPNGHEFLPGTVTAVRHTDSGAWGKYVTTRNESGIYVTYAHLSEVKVSVGQVIKKEENMKPSECPADPQFVQFCYNGELFRDATPAEVQSRVGQSCLTVVTSIMSSPEWKEIQYRQADYSRVVKEFEAYKEANPPGGGGNCTVDERAYLDSLYKVLKEK